MRDSFREDLLGGLSYCLEVQLSEQVGKKNLEYIPSLSLRVDPVQACSFWATCSFRFRQ